MTLHKLDKIILPGPVALSQISNGAFNANTEFIKGRPAGHPTPLFNASSDQKPTLEFSTTQLASLLGVIGPSGAGLAAITGYLKKAAAAGSVARATEEHISLVVNESVAFWSTITLPHNGEAEAQVTVQCVYDGTNEPIVYTGSVALSGNLSAAEYFGVGPGALNGSDISGIQEITINSGVKLIVVGESSGLWPTFAAVQETDPVITVKLNHEINWSSVGLDGTALNGTSGLTFYARKYAANGSRVANATASHIKFVVANGQATPLNTTGQGTDLVTDSFQVNAVAPDDSTQAIVITVGSAIT